LDILRAYARLPESVRLATDFIFAGNLDRRYEEKHRWEEELAKTPGARHITGFDDNSLAELYRGAQALVMASSHEGFGLPLVEAMRSGAPTIVSDIGPLREIAGDSALYFKVGEIDALKTHLYNVASDRTLALSMIERGLKRADTFTWNQAARLTLELYEKILRTSRATVTST
jgi:alpha-1,3-rhamnosyl/mannosyltransferase